jgi:hypothetical protein
MNFCGMLWRQRTYQASTQIEARRFVGTTQDDYHEESFMFERHRDKNGEMSRKHGNTLIGTLRKHYGPWFAPGCADKARLSDVLDKVDEPSLSKLVADLESGKLSQICKNST